MGGLAHPNGEVWHTPQWEVWHTPMGGLDHQMEGLDHQWEVWTTQWRVWTTHGNPRTMHGTVPPVPYLGGTVHVPGTGVSWQRCRHHPGYRTAPRGGPVWALGLHLAIVVNGPDSGLKCQKMTKNSTLFWLSRPLLWAK